MESIQQKKKPDPRTRLKAVYRNVFSSDSGRIVLKDLMQRSGILKPTTIPGDAILSAFNDGQRQIVLGVLRQMSPDDQRNLVETAISDGPYPFGE